MWRKIKNIYHLSQSLVAAFLFGFPTNKLTVIAVTGTDGKTTTVNMIYHILTSVGLKASMVSSLGAKIGNKSQSTGYHVSTPSPFQVQKLLKEAVDAGSKYFVLEATSHGLDQNRLAFVKIKVAAITNITDEHLDYHKTWDRYAVAKSKLFKDAEFSILNKDDKSYDFLRLKTGSKIKTYSLKQNADFNPKNFGIKLKIDGDYNLYNAMAAAAATSTIGIKKEKIIASLKTFQGISGRLQEISMGQKFRAIVDFAHTPNALENVLKTLQGQGKLIAVFGAAGKRDSLKRPKMGRIAATLADITILTAEDPRGINPKKIATEIAQGFKDLNKKEGVDYFVITNRREAIEKAVKMAKPNDTVGFFGKGHEKSMNINGQEEPWNEVEEVKKAIKKIL